ncbi:MAG: hypothetical protein NTZ92_05410 [Candidatus Omnitrophica bacterium]|nr:hypothetical protein [Candidatus Omnitrophota bacterium]
MNYISDIKESIDLLDRLKNIWESKKTIAIILFVILTSGMFLFNKIDIHKINEQITGFELLILTFICLGIWIVWLLTRLPPRIKRNKIGIAIAISTENDKSRIRFKNDFIENLRDVIRRGNHQQLQLISLSEYHSEKINRLKLVKQYHKKTKAHLIIYGACKIRTHEKKESYYFKLDASVLHRVLPKVISNSISVEMRKVLPPSLIFSSDDEIKGFMVTAETIGHASRYIIGLASLFSGDVFTAFDLHLGLISEIDVIEKKQEELKEDLLTVRRLVPFHLVDEALILARVSYLQKKSNYLENLCKYLEVLERFDPRNYVAHLMRGIYYFLAKRDTEAALEEIKKSRNERDNTWQINEAFLKAYKGDLPEAHKLYKRALVGLLKENVPLETEGFIYDILQLEPDKIQLWYCLGIINYLFKEDLKLAKEYFEKFVELARKEKKFLESVSFAEKYLVEIKEKFSN